MNIDTITVEDFRKRLKHLCVRNRLTGLPRKYKDKLIILNCIARSIDPGRVYNEQEFNLAILQWLGEYTEPASEDYVTPRRWLVDQGFVVRTADGSSYRVDPNGPGWRCFESGVPELDISALIDAWQEERTASGRA